MLRMSIICFIIFTFKVQFLIHLFDFIFTIFRKCAPHEKRKEEKENDES